MKCHIAGLNLHVSTMTPTKFQLNPTYGYGKILFQEFQEM